jgi:hypothetical protein
VSPAAVTGLRGVRSTERRAGTLVLAEDLRLVDLPFGTLVTRGGRLYRTVRRRLSCAGAPGLHRVSYDLEPAFVGSSGLPTWGVFREHCGVKVAKLALVAPETKTFDRALSAKVAS